MEVIEPLLKAVVKILQDAIKAVKALVDLNVNGILHSVTGLLLDLDAVVRLIADVLCVSGSFLIFHGFS